jgi:hypothetical protein
MAKIQKLVPQRTEHSCPYCGTGDGVCNHQPSPLTEQLEFDFT